MRALVLFSLAVGSVIEAAISPYSGKLTGENNWMAPANRPAPANRTLAAMIPVFKLDGPGQEPIVNISRGSSTRNDVFKLDGPGQCIAPLPVDSQGRLDESQWESLPWQDIKLVCVILAHNETGVIQDVSRLANLCRQHGAALLLDAVQAVGKTPVDFAALKLDGPGPADGPERGAIPKNAPPILDRLNLSPELWLHAVEHFGKRRAANRITPASRFNATARPAPQPVAFQ